jgi:proteasome lid subunit RPN8/RPN11
VFERSSQESPKLRFSPTAWAKLLFLRDYGDTEVGGFGIAPATDLLYVEDVRLVRQVSTGISVAFQDDAVADFFDEQVDAGLQPQQFARLWLHSHPGDCPQPSSRDEETFLRVFGKSDWAVMFILAQGGQNYARLQFHVGPGGGMMLPVVVDYSRPFSASDHAAWEEEYLANVQEPLPVAMADNPLNPINNQIIKSFDPFEDDFWAFIDEVHGEDFPEREEVLYAH